MVSLLYDFQSFVHFLELECLILKEWLKKGSMLEPSFLLTTTKLKVSSPLESMQLFLVSNNVKIRVQIPGKITSGLNHPFVESIFSDDEGRLQ